MIGNVPEDASLGQEPFAGLDLTRWVLNRHSHSRQVFLIDREAALGPLLAGLEAILQQQVGLDPPLILSMQLQDVDELLSIILGQNLRAARDGIGR